MSKSDPLADTIRPRGGWLRAMRLANGLSLQAVADRLDVSPQAVHQFEKSEVAGTISLRQLALVAAAMGCQVGYSLHDAASRSTAAPAEAPSPQTPPAPVASESRAAPTVSLGPSPTAPPASIALSLFMDNQESGRFD